MTDPANAHYLPYDLTAKPGTCSCGSEPMRRSKGVLENVKVVHGVTHRWGSPCYYGGK